MFEAPTKKRKTKTTTTPPAIERLHTVEEAADILSIHVETLRRYLRSGCPHERSAAGYMVDVGEILNWMKATNRTGKRGAPGSPEIRAARTRKELAIAELSERKLTEARAALFVTAEAEGYVVQVVQEAIAEITAAFTGIEHELVSLDAPGAILLLDARVIALLTKMSTPDADEKADPTPPAAPAVATPPADLDAARLRKENAFAAAYELQLAIGKGELTDATDFMLRFTERITEAKSILLNMPAAIAPQAAGLDTESIRGLVQSHLAQTFEALTRKT